MENEAANLQGTQQEPEISADVTAANSGTVYSQDVTAIRENGFISPEPCEASESEDTAELPAQEEKPESFMDKVKNFFD